MTRSQTRQLAAIMFTDMVGYTALMQKDEVTAKRNRDHHRRILEKYITENYGKILQYYGDGSLSIFGSVIDAVNSAIHIQQELQKEPKVPIRIGIHSGDVVHDEDGIYGDGVNVASRIETLAIPGSVLVSEKVFDEIKNQTQYLSQPLGKFELKNVSKPIEVYALANKGLAVPDRRELRGKTKETMPSIAVLPFVNMSNDPENEYFSDGITEEILNALVKLEGIRVTARTSSFVFKGKNEDVRSIGKQLEVSNVLEGSVRKANNQVRITAQLINTADGYHHWSETYDRKLEDIFAVQDEISRKIANQLRITLTGDEVKESMVTAPTDNLEAYNIHLKGLYHMNRWTPADAAKALGFFEQAIQLQPDFALPYAGISYAYSMLGGTGHAFPKEVFPKAEEAALKALKLDDSSPSPFIALGMINVFYYWNLDKAKSYYQKALDLAPGSAITIFSHYVYLIAARQFNQAVETMEKAIKLDPLSLPINCYLAEAYSYANRLDDALVQYNKTLEMDPHFRVAMEGRGWCYTLMGDYDKAIAAFLEQHQSVGHALKGITGLGYAYGKSGNTKEAEACLDKLNQREQSDEKVLLHSDFAAVYAGLGNIKKVLYHMEKGLGEKMGALFFNIHPIWQEFHDDPRFFELLDNYPEIE